MEHGINISHGKGKLATEVRKHEKKYLAIIQLMKIILLMHNLGSVASSVLPWLITNKNIYLFKYLSFKTLMW